MVDKLWSTFLSPWNILIGSYNDYALDNTFV